jgi:beclin 1
VCSSDLEINAALGFLCLLIDVIVKKCEITLSQYRLLPRGSYSVIIKKSDRSTLELYADETSGGLTRFLTGRKFDSAMHALLQIVNEITWNIQRENKNFRIPFPIDDVEGKIDGIPVSLQFNSEDNWTKAMKMLLANVKRVMLFVEQTPSTQP